MPIAVETGALPLPPHCHCTTHAALTMLAIFIVSGVFSMLASAVFVPGYITVGASGAEFGLLGALIADVCVNWHEGSWRESASRLASIITNVGLNLALGLMVPFVDNWCDSCCCQWRCRARQTRLVCYQHMP